MLVYVRNWNCSSETLLFYIQIKFCTRAHYASVGGVTRNTVILRVCLSALVLKDGKESAGGKCNIDRTC